MFGLQLESLNAVTQKIQLFPTFQPASVNYFQHLWNLQQGKAEIANIKDYRENNFSTKPGK